MAVIPPDVINEPEINNWEVYKSYRYGIEVDFPAGWFKDELIAKDPEKDTTIINFNSRRTPGANFQASDFHSIQITPVSNRDQFFRFQDNINSIGREGSRAKEASLGGISGFDNGNVVAVIHNDYIYELLPKLVREEDGQFVFSKISQHVKDSITFFDIEENLKEREDIEVVAGEIVRLTADGRDRRILEAKKVEKGGGITHLDSVRVSPDRSKFCFLAYTDIPIWLYWVNENGRKPTKIAEAINCAWSGNNKTIAYNNHERNIAPVDVYVYDIETQEIKNFTKDKSEDPIIRFYELPIWTSIGTLTSRYTAFDSDGKIETTTGISTINVLTGEVIDN